MDTRYLRAFVAVAELGGISAAAQQLGYAQSSVSAQLKRLEAELGTDVLLRGGAGASLTEAGARLLPHAREALELEQRMHRAALGSRPRLRIGSQESLAHAWLPEVLAALEYGAGGAGSGADVELTVSSRARIEQAFRDGELDLIFRYDSGAVTPGPHAVVGHDRTLLVAAPHHPLARAQSLTPEQLLPYDFLVAEPACTSQMLVDRLGRDLLANAQLSTITGSLSALLRLAGHGHGLALLPHQSVARELASGELVELRLAEPVRPVSITAHWHPRLGLAERPLHALLELARRADPLPAVGQRAAVG
ncbi:LysR family transcriptional regulator [Kitasatospora sp. GAS204B]|uniref:LysR family transcriptional regulator n=1 Tax=unclassified Kitasatospora TaxID=2633591 RepID=UPI002476EF96|nr:LysR family transcriptional regulator [Kitasatospora sp. GAS204B]MDH6116976.1 DNA-binding transcriptional LysR family regulator [Kitasatospora sp. GAS204B]